MDFFNVYEDAAQAESCAKLDFPGTYYLAFRDLPKIIADQIRGTTSSGARTEWLEQRAAKSGKYPESLITSAGARC
jgi:hypothetical protein